MDEEIDLFSSPSSSVQTGIPPTRTISISQDALEQMQEMNRVMINQRMEINHLKAQLARCVAGRDMAENVLDGNVSANPRRLYLWHTDLTTRCTRHEYERSP